MEDIHYRPIGVIYSPFKEPSGMPIQPAGAEDIEGTIELFDEFTASLKNLDGFSHITLIYHFHLAKKTSLELSPYMDNTEKRGVFATRAPSRPNPIGISVVKLIKIENHILHIKNVDIVDGTPLLDIKCYVPRFIPDEACKIGWLEKNVDKVKSTKSDNRFKS